MTISDLAGSGGDSPLRDVQLELVDSVDKAMEFKRWLSQSRRALGVDTESGGLRPDLHRLRLVQFGDMTRGWAIPWDRWGGVTMEALNQYEGPLVFHNAGFDCRFLQAHAGWSPPWSRIHDTMTMAHLVDPSRPKGLKPLSARLIDPRATAGETLLHTGMGQHGWTGDTVPTDFPPYWVDGALDPVLTCHVFEKLGPTLKARHYETAYDLEMTTVRICADMMTRGINIDLGYCDQKAEELRGWVVKAREMIKREYGVDNPTSNRQVIAKLQRDGVELTKRTASGADLALDKEVLNALDHPLAEYVLAIRKAEKICSTYLENFSEMIGPDGRLHPSINPLGARTGRMSITGPALQTLQRDDPTVRTAFIPSAGNRLVLCDADQIEMRLAAHFSHDQGLIDAFHQDADFFCVLASQIFGEDVKKGDRRRQITKNTGYGKLYGAGAPTIARTAKITLEAAAHFVQAFDDRFPGITQLMTKVVNEAEQRRRDEGRAYVRTPLGREVPADDEREYALVNYLIQSHAAEILKRGLADLEAADVARYLVLPVHDEVVLDVPEAEVADVVNVVESTLNDLTTYEVPLTWSAETHPSWGAKYRK